MVARSQQAREISARRGRHFVQAPSMPREETDVVVVLLKTGA